METELCEGLSRVEDSGGNAHRNAASSLSLPAGFDFNRFASKWVADGNEIDEAKQPKFIQSVGLRADGWQVYKQIQALSALDELANTKLPKEERKKPAMVPVVRISSGKPYVLMFRPKALQRALNVIHANESRDLVTRELSGQSAIANETGDPGILTNEDMKQFNRVSDAEDRSSEYLGKTTHTPSPQQAVELDVQQS